MGHACSTDSSVQGCKLRCSACLRGGTNSQVVPDTVAISSLLASHAGACLVAVPLVPLVELQKTFREDAGRGRRPLATVSDRTTWSQIDVIKSLLCHGDVKLLRGSWLMDRATSCWELDLAGPMAFRIHALPRRQDLERFAASAFLDPACLQVGDVEGSHLLDARTGRAVHIASVSYCWWTEDHPDPDGSQLRQLANVVAAFADLHTCEVAVFLDWCSLPQLPRTSEEAEVFQRGLENIHVWYAHPMVKVMLMTVAPFGSIPYEARGWPTFEQATSELLHDPSDVMDVSQIVRLTRSEDQLFRGWKRPPLRPDQFRELLKERTFRDESDRGLVVSLYEKMFESVMGSVVELVFSGLHWDTSSVMHLAMLLPHCLALRGLNLSLNDSCDEGTAALAEVLPGLSLQRLGLQGNNIGNGGAHALAKALPHCRSLRILGLSFNDIGDCGAYSLADAVGQCPALQALDVSANRLSRMGVVRLERAWDSAGKVHKDRLFPNLSTGMQRALAGAFAPGRGDEAASSEQDCDVEWTADTGTESEVAVSSLPSIVSEKPADGSTTE